LWERALHGNKAEPLRADHHQLTLILDVLGTPSLEDFYNVSSHRSREYLRALPFKRRRPFASLYPNANPLAVDLLEKCLTFNPKKRINVEEALAHPVRLLCESAARSHWRRSQYLEPYHDPEDEPTAAIIPQEFFAFDGQNLSREDLKRAASKNYHCRESDARCRRDLWRNHASASRVNGLSGRYTFSIIGASHPPTPPPPPFYI
jgi:mitogen-activated protein kinase 1/3